MNTAVQRLLTIACVTSALTLSAQTTKKTTTTTSTPQPATVTADPAQSSVDVPRADQASTVTVTADTRIERNGARVTLAAIQVGDRIEAAIGADGNAVRVEASGPAGGPVSPAPFSRIEGTETAIDASCSLVVP